jgi:hypothetical protein
VFSFQSKEKIIEKKETCRRRIVNIWSWKAKFEDCDRKLDAARLSPNNKRRFLQSYSGFLQAENQNTRLQTRATSNHWTGPYNS